MKLYFIHLCYLALAISIGILAYNKGHTTGYFKGLDKPVDAQKLLEEVRKAHEQMRDMPETNNWT
jgi:FixJ family two-component response regulator